uniref:Rad4 beta-hairpin domain-containing protein n=1 Tax=Anopheles epiroticus TaxID=199890 RepID=A0A182P8P2_9DIPT
MSDEEDILSASGEDDDFSASEDEWLPTKDKKKKPGRKSKHESSSDEEDGESSEYSEEESDLDDFVSSSSKKKGKQPTARKRTADKSTPSQEKQSMGGNKRKRLSPGLRDRLYQQYKKDLLKEIAPVKPPLNSSVSDILQKCQFQRSKPKPSVEAKSSTANDSDSSGDDHLVDPGKLDLGAKFFEKGAPPPSEPSGSKDGPPHFDVNAGMRLSDSSDGEGGDQHTGEESLPASIPKQAADKLISHINQQSSEFMNFTNLDQFTAKLEEAKMFLKSYQQRETDGKVSPDPTAPSQTSEQKKENVSSLLAMGETDLVSSAGAKKASAAIDASSDSDWEEVEAGDGPKGKDNEEATKPTGESGGWQVTIEMETAQSRRKRREELEMELYIKREINRVKRKIQLNYHKSSVLAAVCIGRRVNDIINSSPIRGLLMSVMQSKCSETKVKWDEKKMQNLAAWYKQEFTLVSNDFLSPRNGCHLSFALMLAIYTRKIACRYDYVLLFLACLRLAGVQARLVLCANVPPKRPAMSDLCPMSERQIKEKIEKRASNSGAVHKQEEHVKAPDDPVQKKITEGKKKEKDPPKINLPSATQSEGKKEICSIATLATKENPAPTRRSPRGISTVKKEVAQPRAATTRGRKALTTLNIPQLDGGDDQVIAPISTIPVTRSLRSRSVSAVLAESPGSSPFAKRKSNTPTANVDATAPKSQSIATRKRKLFATQPEVKAVSPTATRTSARKSGKKTPIQQEAKEPRVKRRTIRPDPPSDDDAFEVTSKVSKHVASSSKDEKDVAKRTVTRKQEDSKPDKPAKLPTIVLEDIANKSTESEKLAEGASSCTEGETVAPKKSKAPARKRTTLSRNKKQSTPVSDDSAEDSDFEVRKKSPKEQKKRTSSATKAKRSPRAAARQKPAGEDQENQRKTDLWIEFYCEKSKRWTTFDLASEQVDCVNLIVRNAPNPIAYVFGWNEGYLKDVSARYVKNWNTTCRMLRVESAWLEKVLHPFVGEKTEMDTLEEKELNKLDADKPLPQTISELKNHPLYALRRHLLKFEALYPPEPPTLGFIRGEAIYPRECVYTLQTREKWYKQGRVVRPFETAYKVVKCWKYDRPNNNWLKDQPCDIFGLWQTDEYDPPTAENGIVPRNEYGNVELFTEKMLPKGTVHLKLPGLNKVCKRLQIDCAPALTGFDMAKMRVVPVYDGFVVCKEFAEQVVEEWYKEMEKEDQREQEKLEKRVYGNWKRLIKGLLVRRKLQNKYNFDNLAQ